ncbi:hypothetical protein [Vibrio furnissii]|uniref:hypothetical protein n=1 Tax=Vibrio furnissii TaxID=29494 RepID=UPI001E2DEBE5|nr:hypothetical protein [Vibrio furnissii]UHJ58896.1 hypothetical protein LUM42_08365 [Vibrio furnissii]WJG24845.1 hypothetical protein QSU96_08425 [Vibrio furnissii]
MKNRSIRPEVKLIGVAILSALILIFAHLILAKSFAGLFWTEYTAAAIPFVMLAICILSVRYAAKMDIDS